MNKILCIILLLTLTGLNAAGNNTPGKKTSTKTSSATVVARDSKIKLSRANFEDSIQSLYNAIGLAQYGLKYEVFRYGMIGFHALKNEGKLGQKNIVSFIDFTQKSTEKRFYTVDLDELKVKFHSLVSHGKNTGENEAKFFSNIPNSNQSSLGFYVTGETYVGSKGYSLRLDGVEGSINNNMRNRAVVMHDAEYVSEAWIKRYGRIGRSQGCPALPKDIAKKVIDTIKEKTAIFAYYNDQNYMKSSSYLNLENLLNQLESVEAVAANLK
jgi:hypothetical protein